MAGFHDRVNRKCIVVYGIGATHVRQYTKCVFSCEIKIFSFLLENVKYQFLFAKHIARPDPISKKHKLQQWDGK